MFHFLHLGIAVCVCDFQEYKTQHPHSVWMKSTLTRRSCGWHMKMILRMEMKTSLSLTLSLSLSLSNHQNGIFFRYYIYFRLYNLKCLFSRPMHTYLVCIEVGCLRYFRLYFPKHVLRFQII